MKRVLSSVLVIAAIVMACERTPVGPDTGGITLEVYTIESTPSGGGAAAVGPGEPARAHVVLDSARITLTGPTSQSLLTTPGQSVTFSGLAEGSYTVVLQAWTGDELTYMGTVTNIQVVGGQDNTVAQVLFAQTTIGFTAVDETLQLTSPSGTGWISADEGIVTVDAAGVVTAVSNGQAAITGTLGSSTVVVQVHVEQTVASVTVEPASMTINPGATFKFDAIAKDDNGIIVEGVNFLWISSDHNVATVDQSGLATGVRGGSVTISAAGRGEPGNATLVVNQTPARLGFRTQPGNAVGGDAMSAFEVEIQDANGGLVGDATNSVVLELGTNPASGILGGTVSVAAVNGVARFTAATIDKVGNGYTIQATSGSLSNVTSTPFDIVHRTIVVTPGDLRLFIAPGTLVQYQAIGVNPFTGAVSSPRVTWTVDDPGVARIDVDRGVLEAVANGTANVTATTTFGANGSTTFTSSTVKLTKLLEFPYSIPLTPMQLTWDGTNYYLSNGGSAASGTIQQLDAAGTVTQTTPVNLDMRGVFYRQADATFYMKSFGLDWYTINPTTGVFTPLLTGIFIQNQSRPDLSADESLIYEHISGTIRVLDFATGTELSTFAGLQDPASFPHDHVVAAPDGKLITMDASGLAYMYDSQGRLVTTFTFPDPVMNQSAWTLSYTNDMLFISDTGSGVGTFRGYRIDMQ